MLIGFDWSVHGNVMTRVSTTREWLTLYNLPNRFKAQNEISTSRKQPGSQGTKATAFHIPRATVLVHQSRVV